jgi:glycosyltransferase involved in cell wall biosynthesis
MSRPRLLVVGPLPPPVHGVTISTSLILDNEFLAKQFVVSHLNTSDHRDLTNLGRWDIQNLRLACRNLLSLLHMTRGEPGLLYLPLSQNLPAFLRDSLFILTARARRWAVAFHLRGGEFRDFYDAQPTLIRLWIRYTLSRVRSAAVMGHSLRWLFEGLIPSERIAVVPNGTPDISSEGIVRDPTQVLFLGNFLRRKGIQEAVATALEVTSRRQDAAFVFAGQWEDAALENDLRAAVSHRSNRIHFVSPHSPEEKHRLLLSSSVFLFPPVEPEGHPRVILEALAAGLPVVSTDRGAIAETVVNGVTGFVLAQPAPDELAACILRLLGDPELRERMSRAARSRYLAHFTQAHADRAFASWLRVISK